LNNTPLVAVKFNPAPLCRRSFSLDQGILTLKIY